MAEAGRGPVNVNLVPPEQMRPKLRRMLMSSIGIGVVLGLFFGLLSRWWVGLLAAVLLAGPLIALAIAGMRRDQSIDGTELRSTTFSTKVVDLAAARNVMVNVHTGKGGQAMLRADGVTVTLAVYTLDNRGRELPIESVAALADGLRAADAGRRREEIIQPGRGASDGPPDDDALATRTELADLLKAHLRAEAIDAGLDRRPLHRATAYAKPGVRSGTALTGAQVRTLLESPPGGPPEE